MANKLIILWNSNIFGLKVKIKFLYFLNKKRSYVHTSGSNTNIFRGKDFLCHECLHKKLGSIALFPAIQKTKKRQNRTKTTKKSRKKPKKLSMNKLKGQTGLNV